VFKVRERERAYIKGLKVGSLRDVRKERKKRRNERKKLNK
jgi:hypothetical protein